MHALPIIEREWPSVAADLRDGLDVDTVRDRAAELFDSEEYGRLCALLEVHEAEQGAADAERNRPRVRNRGLHMEAAD